MHRIFSVGTGWAFAVFAFLDIICVELGMGVPIFCILFGWRVGWCIARRAAAVSAGITPMIGSILRWAALTSAFTFVLMALVWGRCIVMLFDPAADLANFGIPMMLYEPRASFIGWLVLMIVISPFLQFLMTLFGAHLLLLRWMGQTGRGSRW